MSELVLPREWCASGTKTDPGAALADTGFVAGNPHASAHFNYLLHQASVTGREMFRRACYPRMLLDTDDTTDYLSAVEAEDGPALHHRVTVASVHTGGVPRVRGESAKLGGVPASITTQARAIAKQPGGGGRLVIVGNGGNHNTYSADGGATWFAGGALGSAGVEIIWNESYSRFQAIRNANALFSTDATAWTNVALAGASNSGLGLLPNGNTLIATGFPTLAFSISTNGGTSWAAAGGTTPYQADLDNKGQLAGVGIDYVYHAGLLSDGTIHVSRTEDGTTWTEVAVLESPAASLDFANSDFTDIRLRQCTITGMLVLACETTSGTVLLYASNDSGNTWCDPWELEIAAASAVDVAAGRIFVKDADGVLYASDGIK